jgi:PncC family amidohydrolase
MTLEEKVGQELKARGLRIALAESCTGGLIGHRITGVAGASDYFEAGFITYSNKAKELFLHVSGEVIAAYGAVSKEAAELMAEGARKAAGTEIGLAATGIAGPGGGTPEKPVGTVYIGLATPHGTFVHKYSFRGNRSEIKMETSEAGLRLLHDYLEGRFA